MIIDTYKGRVDTMKPIPAVMIPWMGAELEASLGRSDMMPLMEGLMEANGIGEHDEAIREACAEAGPYDDWETLAYDPDWEIRRIHGNQYGILENTPYTGMLNPAF